jgi:hypothetical protein
MLSPLGAVALFPHIRGNQEGGDGGKTPSEIAAEQLRLEEQARRNAAIVAARRAQQERQQQGNQDK